MAADPELSKWPSMMTLCSNCGAPLRGDDGKFYHLAIPDPVGRISRVDINTKLMGSFISFGSITTYSITVQHLVSENVLEEITLHYGESDRESIGAGISRPSLPFLQRIFRACMALGWINTEVNDE